MGSPENTTTGSDFVFDENGQDEGSDVILGCCMAYGVLTSLFLVLTPICPRMRLPPFVVLSSWALANMAYLCVKGSNYFSHSNWSSSQFWCESGHFLTVALSFLRPYILVVTSVFLLIGSNKLRRWTSNYPWVFTFVPYISTVLIWALIFLSTVEYRSQAAIKDISSQDSLPKELCTVTPTHSSRMTELVLLYILPPVILASLLACWGCARFWSQEASDQKDKAAVLSLLFLLYLFVASHFNTHVLVPFPDGNNEVTSYTHKTDPKVARAYLLTEYLDLVDYIVSPTICIVVLVIYRGAFFAKGAANPSETVDDGNAQKSADS